MFVAGVPYPKRKTGGDKAAAERWSSEVARQTSGLPKVGGPCRLKVTFVLPASRYSDGHPYAADLDNYVKRLLDALKGTALSGPDEDGAILELVAAKRMADPGEPPGALLELERVGLEFEADEVLYFAYGSNMHRGRMKRRVPSARDPVPARLQGYRLEFTKRSADGSGKATIAPLSDESSVWGVLWRFRRDEQDALDRAEGLGRGYVKRTVIVGYDRGYSTRAFTYLAGRGMTSPALRPFDWYKAIVVAGAEQNGLPDEYLAALRAVPVNPDHDQDRRAHGAAELAEEG